jgi:hypothetical protein
LLRVPPMAGHVVAVLVVAEELARRRHRDRGIWIASRIGDPGEGARLRLPGDRKCCAAEKRTRADQGCAASGP